MKPGIRPGIVGHDDFKHRPKIAAMKRCNAWLQLALDISTCLFRLLLSLCVARLNERRSDDRAPGRDAPLLRAS
ncbi:hypothetical protein [Burkholderia sp. WAC0059]|uniref:hypothetical protein n=1 Tax=Burkholderia sp. WAC0059 TaxID=2066022 RepID=UPI0011AF2684|nr:hypothetical protein [Burkholderia sp. WAC0059]